MANEKQLHEALRFRPWPPGDPWVLVEAVLNEIDPAAQKQVMVAALDAAHTTLQANLKLVDNLRQIVGGQSR